MRANDPRRSILRVMVAGGLRARLLGGVLAFLLVGVGSPVARLEITTGLCGLTSLQPYSQAACAWLQPSAGPAQSTSSPSSQLTEITQSRRTVVNGVTTEHFEEKTTTNHVGAVGPSWEWLPGAEIAFAAAFLGLLLPSLFWTLFGIVGGTVGTLAMVWLLVEAWGSWLRFSVLLAPTAMFVWLLPRLYYLVAQFVVHRLYRTGAASAPRPLPSQDSVVSQLLQSTADFAGSMGRTPNTVALHGEWGTGKSTVVRQYLDRAASRPDIVTVYIDAWRLETEPHPEFAVYREIAKTWPLLWPFGWLTVPVIRLLVSRWLQVFKVTLKVSEAQVTVEPQTGPAAPPMVVWRAALENLVAANRFHRNRVVIVLDEIDRCGPVAAQRFVTLIRRFLSVPGISVVFPYVERQLRYKVFHPAQIRLPDLAASAEGLLWEVFGNCVDANDCREDRGGQQGAAPNVRVEAGNLRVTADHHLQSPRDRIAECFEDRLLMRFMRARPAIQRRFMALMEDKYLSDDRVYIPRLTADDFVDFIVNVPSVKRLVGDIFQGQRVGDRTWIDERPNGFQVTFSELFKKLFARYQRRNARYNNISIRQLYAATSSIYSIADQVRLRGLLNGPQAEEKALVAVSFVVMSLLHLAATRASPNDPALAPCEEWIPNVRA